MRVSFTLIACLLLAPAAGAEEPKSESDSVRMLCDQTLAIANRAVEQYGATDSAMIQIRGALAELAKVSALKEYANLRQLHGSTTSSAAILASRGDDSISLFIVRFDPGQPTPVHDHLTWGVVHVLEGRDHYIHWRADYDAKDTTQADVLKTQDLILGPGSSVYWLGPPHDLHSQEALDAPVWELVLAGKNLLGPSVLDNRHNYDPITGRVTRPSAK